MPSPSSIEGRGASLTASAGRAQTVVSSACLAEDLGHVLPVVAAVVRTPSLPPDEVATRRSEMLTEIQEADDDPGAVAVDALLGVLYPPPHPLGRPVRGRTADVTRLERGDLAAFHRRWFHPAADHGRGGRRPRPGGRDRSHRRRVRRLGRQRRPGPAGAGRAAPGGSTGSSSAGRCRTSRRPTSPTASSAWPVTTPATTPRW